ncbi:MAG: MFS transporter [Alphaproteobacteria bacterium]|nr:MFS transporter [Alphaproteobacteria bacterium]
MTAPASSARKLLVLGALYAAQGLPFGFFTQALPVMLRTLGTSLEQIGLASLLAAPWALKALWAPVVERRGDLRRWLLALQAAAVAGLVVAAFVDPTASLAVLAGVVLFTNLVAATQDIATDGVAVTVLGADERGWGNGLQVAGYRVGMMVGGGALLAVFDQLGWTSTLLLLAVGLVACTVPLLLSPGFGSAEVPAPPQRFAWDWLTLPGALPWIAVLVAFKVGDYAAGGMMRPWLVDRGVDLTTMAAMLGGAGFTAGLVGAMLGGALVGRFGRVPVLLVASAGQALVLAVYAVLARGEASDGAVWAAILTEHLVSGVATASLFTAMMDASRPAHGATDYTLQASIVVVASMLGAGLSGYGAAHLGYAGLFALGAGLAAVAPVLVAVPACTALVRAGVSR